MNTQESNKLTTLKNELQKVNKRRLAIQGQIEDLEQQEHLPGYIERYEGKYFRYQNSTGPDDKWPLYIFVSKITYQRYGRGFKADGLMFEKSNSEEVTFKFDNVEYLLDGATEISKSEFRKALTRTNSFIHKMIEILP